MHCAVCRGCPAAWKVQLEETEADLKVREAAVKNQQEDTAKKEKQLDKEQQRLAAESKRLQVRIGMLSTLAAAASNIQHIIRTSCACAADRVGWHAWQLAQFAGAAALRTGG
jgi:hypothetical protein